MSEDKKVELARICDDIEKQYRYYQYGKELQEKSLKKYFELLAKLASFGVDYVENNNENS